MRQMRISRETGGHGCQPRPGARHHGRHTFQPQPRVDRHVRHVARTQGLFRPVVGKGHARPATKHRQSSLCCHRPKLWRQAGAVVQGTVQDGIPVRCQCLLAHLQKAVQQALLVIEENQLTLRAAPEEILTEECEAQFKSGPHTAHRTADGDHRRIESRQGWVLGDPDMWARRGTSPICTASCWWRRNGGRKAKSMLKPATSPRPSP